MYAMYLDVRIKCFKDLKHDFVRTQAESNRRSDGLGANCESWFGLGGLGDEKREGVGDGRWSVGVKLGLCWARYIGYRDGGSDQM